MKSLQVMTPARKCIFNCPFCIAKTHEHQNAFVNNYEGDYQFWEESFISVLEDSDDLKTVVITGTNEPIQDEACAIRIANITHMIRPDVQVELQTRFYRKCNAFNYMDVVAFSISDYNYLNRIENIAGTARYVIILTDSFNELALNDIINKIPSNIKQLTFKILHDSNGYNKELDEWIANHKTNNKTVTKLIVDVMNYKGDLDIFFDENCMIAEDRYMVFREDGQLYDSFDSNEPYKMIVKCKR